MWHTSITPICTLKKCSALLQVAKKKTLFLTQFNCYDFHVLERNINLNSNIYFGCGAGEDGLPYQAVSRQYLGSIQAVSRQYPDSIQAVSRQYPGSI